MRLPLPANVRKDVFLSALLEMPTTKRTSRNPLEWANERWARASVVGLQTIQIESDLIARQSE